ncbi:MAG: hypothetical protein JSS53_04245, partial [Proteobacteria bacterium]|nr:hypothetical protein [Pseudomonadota bacterium]
MVSLKQLDNYDFHAELALQWLTAQIHDDGSYGRKINDLACYYKSPYLFSLTDHHHDAHKMLDFIKQKFMQDDGDFISLKGDKSENAAFNEFWSYTNGWITLAAQKLGRFDISYPAFEYLYSFYHPTLGAFT